MKFFLLSATLFLSLWTFAQITTDPAYPTADNPVTIYFDATGTELEGYTGDVYAHTGINNWQYVIGSWGDNSTQPKLTRISTDHYKLTITPSIRSFYNVPDGTDINQLCFVFRSEDGNLQSRPDYFVKIYGNNPEISFVNDTNSIYTAGDSVRLQIVALFAHTIKFYVHDTLFCTADTGFIDTSFVAADTGRIPLKAIAFDNTDTVRATSFFFVRKKQVVAPLPAGVTDGINYIDDNTVTLVLYAPLKKFVFLKGDFNNWALSLDYQMHITPDSTRFWLTINNLQSQKKYGFQYYVDGEISIADPYCEEIADPWNDPYISSSVFPDKYTYPQGKTEGIVGILQTAKPAYNWKTTDFRRPDVKDLVIYELLVRDFTTDHTFEAVIDKIPYLKKLGINAIELMPVNEFEGNISWGYNPDYFFAVDKYYGPANKLKELIDSCHSNGIAVISDVVLNHAYGLCPLVQLYLDRNTWKVTPDNPWFNVDCPNTVYCYGYDFNHQSEATKYFVSRFFKYWLQEFKFDGFRLDFAKGFTNTTGDGSAYDSQRISILKSYADTVWSVSPGAYYILEYFVDNNEEKVMSDYGALTWGNANYNYAQASMGYPDGSDFSWISYKVRGFNNPTVVGYMESHDEERMMYRNLNWGRTNGTYNIRTLSTALDRVKMATAMFLTVPGPKMLWQFEELGYDYSIDYCENGTIDGSCRVDPKPVRWDYYDDKNRRLLYWFVADLIKLKKNHDIFKTSDFQMNVANYVKQIKLNSDTNALIIANTDVAEHTVTPDFQHSGTWFDYFSGESIESGTSITLKAGEFKMFFDKQMPPPSYPAPPEITEINIDGNTQTGDTLTLTYTYFDLNRDPEGNTIIKWFTCDNNAGANKTYISGANSKQLILSNEQIGKYIGAEVTPVAQSTDETTGEPVSSQLLGPVTASSSEPMLYPNPTHNALIISNLQSEAEIIISDTQGKIIDKFSAENMTVTKDYSQLEAGIYFVKIITENGIFKTKFIKL